MARQRQPVEKSTRTDYAVQQVREYIFSNGLKPGDQLPGELALAKHLKVSRPTVREAIAGLSVSGLLEAKPRTGTRVREFAFERVVEAMVDHFYLSDLPLTEILEARASLELSALPFVVRRATPQQIGELRAVEVRFEQAIGQRGGAASIRHAVSEDLRLHEGLMKASGNRLLANMVGLLRAFFDHPSLDSAILQRHFDAEEQQRTAEEHRRLIDAVAAGDEACAREVLTEHFQRQLLWLSSEQPEG